jgi:hypothetical protein
MEPPKCLVSDIAGTLIFALVAGLVAGFYWWFSGTLYDGGISALGTLFRLIAVLAIVAAAAASVVALIQAVLVPFRHEE